MKKNILKFTGERLIPENNIGQAFYYEHLTRYNFATQFSKSKTVLDIACGTGYGSQLLSTKGEAIKVIGIDISKNAIEFSKKYYQEDNINFLIDDAQTLTSQSDDSFDLIVSFETIEHINYPEKFIKQTKRLLKKDGILIISTPNANTYPKGNKYHINEQSPNEFRSLLKKYYKNIENFYQKFYLSNLISKENEINFNNINKELEVGDTNCEYLICVCSDQKIPNSYGVINNINKIDQIDVTEGYISLSNQFSNLYEKNKKIEQSIQQKNQNLKEKIKEIETQNEICQQELETIRQSKFFKLWQKLKRLI